MNLRQIFLPFVILANTLFAVKVKDNWLLTWTTIIFLIVNSEANIKRERGGCVLRAVTIYALGSFPFLDATFLFIITLESLFVFIKVQIIESFAHLKWKSFVAK